MGLLDAEGRRRRVSQTRSPTVERRACTHLADGRSIAVPVEWYPRLAHGTGEERNNWRFIGRGEGIHWHDLDEDISVQNLLSGVRSGESQRSFKQWLESRVSAT